jgi:hypothetical protein
MIEGRAYTKDVTPAQVRALARARHGYDPAEVIDAGTCWIATRPAGVEAKERPGSAPTAAAPPQGSTDPVIVGEWLDGEQLRLL